MQDHNMQNLHTLLLIKINLTVNIKLNIYFIQV